MARIVRASLAIRCVQSSCKTLFEVVELKESESQEVICPKCGEHYVYSAIIKQGNLSISESNT